MSHDGCEEVKWKGQAFSYLMHHPNKFHQTENYGSSRAAAAGHQQEARQVSSSSDVNTPAGTGTWHGPAPRGAANPEAALAAADKAAAAVREPATVMLCTGQRMPLIGLGTYKLQSADAVKTALDLGYRHFDCAAFYGNESIVGAGLADFVSSGRRSELFITSKVWNTHHKPADSRVSVEQSLKDLGIDQLDLLLLHWPEAWLPGSDPNGAVHPDTSVTLLEAWRGLEALVDAGLTKAIGLSNASLPQVEEILAAAKHKPAVNQVELHPLLAQRKLVGVSYRKGVVSVAHSCLVRQAAEIQDSPLVQQVAAETGKTINQVLLKWNTQRGVPVIPKATSREHLAENFVGMTDWRLSNAQKALLDGLDQHKRFITPAWKDWGDVEDGGILKPSRVLAAAAGGSAAAATEAGGQTQLQQ